MNSSDSASLRALTPMRQHRKAMPNVTSSLRALMTMDQYRKAMPNVTSSLRALMTMDQYRKAMPNVTSSLRAQRSNLVQGVVWSLVLVAFLMLPANAQASEPAAVLSTKYSVRAPARLGQGFVNTLLGWTSLFTEPVRSVRGGSTAVDGFFRGLAYPFSYTFLGVWDLGTFWVPGMLGYDMAVPLTACPPPVQKSAA